MRRPQSEHVERRARRMVDMITRLDVDQLQLARVRRGDAYMEARTACLHCAHADDCLHWLSLTAPSSGIGNVEPQQAPDFCPNLSLFQSCRRT